MYRVTQTPAREIPDRKGSLNRRIAAAANGDSRKVQEAILPTLTTVREALFFCPGLTSEAEPSRFKNALARALESPDRNAPGPAKG
jgi:hypothetical protein